jgi:mRNA-degrading endonuclease RelE of RelBE toxin-antitoxin system
VAYRVTIPAEAKGHLAGFTRSQQVTILAAIRKHLTIEPAVVTTNRKPMAPNPLAASWELRTGNLRIYYDVDEPAQEVTVLAFGEKVRERVRIGGRFVSLR